MANKVVEQKLIDSTKRALLKYVHIGDGSAAANVLLVDASNLSNALNLNSKIMVANANIRSSYTVSIKRIWGNSKLAGYITLHWASDSNTEIVTIGNGNFDYSFDLYGGSGVITNPTIGSANGTGDILYSVNSPNAADAATIFIDLHKDGNSYDQGQTISPSDFNR